MKGYEIAKELGVEASTVSRDIQYLIIPFTMFCTIQRTGDNHFGYTGFRNPFNHNVLISDGVLNIVVSDWRGR